MDPGRRCEKNKKTNVRRMGERATAQRVLTLQSGLLSSSTLSKPPTFNSKTWSSGLEEGLLVTSKRGKKMLSNIS
jgi:hypothetical protein